MTTLSFAIPDWVIIVFATIGFLWAVVSVYDAVLRTVLWIKKRNNLRERRKEE